MTLPDERTRAVQYARRLLLDLLYPKKTPRVPKAVRIRARDVLRHFPWDWDLTNASRGAPDSFSEPKEEDND